VIAALQQATNTGGEVGLKYVGVDVAKVKAVCCIVNPDGSIAEETSYPNTSHDAATFAKQVIGKHGEFEAVLESRGNLWVKTYEAFESNGITVKLANPVKTRAIAEARVKTDKLDARILAHPLRADLIAECYVPPRNVRESRSRLSHRSNIVKEQTRIKNRIHSLLDKYDLECEYGNIFGTHGMRWLHTLQLQLCGHEQGTLESLLRQLEFLQVEEETANSRIVCDALNSRYVQVIMSMTGFDYYGASLLTAYIGDISRFPSPEHLVSWAGLCPLVHQLGDSLHLGKMKDGNRKTK
jgi:transposase